MVFWKLDSSIRMYGAASGKVMNLFMEGLGRAIVIEVPALCYISVLELEQLCVLQVCGYIISLSQGIEV